MKEINLDELFGKYFNGMYHDDITDDHIKKFALDFGKQLLELASENAMLDDGTIIRDTFDIKNDEIFYEDITVIVDKQSILDTINQVK